MYEYRQDFLAEIAKYIKDEDSLKKLIPGFLIDLRPWDFAPNSDFYSTYHSDLFFRAAKAKNHFFVTILRDEMKRQGQTPIAYYEYNIKEDDIQDMSRKIARLRDDEYDQEVLNEKIDELKNTPAGAFLVERGINLNVTISYSRI